MCFLVLVCIKYKIQLLTKMLFLERVTPSSSYLGFLAEQYYNDKKFADIAYFEPMYLKDFIST